MKVRSGFVSNSSSSSFVIVTTKDAWDAAVKKFTKEVGAKVAKVVVDEYGQPEKVKVLGQEALVFQGVISSEEYGCQTISDLQDDGKITEEEAENLGVEAYESMGKLDEILQKDGVSYVGGHGC